MADKKKTKDTHVPSLELIDLHGSSSIITRILPKNSKVLFLLVKSA